ncbi:DNA polymerase III subunit beta [Candidatus Gracilibacteria bacterium]|nr:DNA polymerase III subunit beta [Candidatus Gracilibacteria bacterium]MCF7856239.1 DNA polymerase III subunit beta [Candidatus Gracilibacteria bacterium]MCF7896696.1 DNA polymerase III subunit beta [Candidatus Gracilibacteria bacterium]
MLLTCEQKDLLAALTTVSKAVNLNSTLPVLNNILLKAENKKLTFAATNLEIAITTSIKSEIKNEGSLTVPARLFTNYVALLSSGKVELKNSEGLDLQIAAAQSKTRIKGISADEFPLIPQVKKEISLTLSAGDLLEAINQVAFAAARDMVRPVLAGVHLRANKKEIRLAATDSYRLSEKILPQVTPPEKEVSIIVPARTVNELARILEKGKENVTLDLSANQVLFLYKNVELASRLIEGSYPDYEQIIPKKHITTISVKNEELSNAVKRVNLFTKDSHSVKLLITADKKLQILSDATQIGEEEAEVTAAIAGVENAVALNANYLLDALSAVGSQDLEIELGEKMVPAVIRAAKKKDYLHLIMPLKV